MPPAHLGAVGFGQSMRTNLPGSWGPPPGTMIEQQLPDPGNDCLAGLDRLGRRSEITRGTPRRVDG